MWKLRKQCSERTFSICMFCSAVLFGLWHILQNNYFIYYNFWTQAVCCGHWLQKPASSLVRWWIGLDLWCLPCYNCHILQHVRLDSCHVELHDTYLSLSSFKWPTIFWVANASSESSLAFLVPSLLSTTCCVWNSIESTVPFGRYCQMPYKICSLCFDACWYVLWYSKCKFVQVCKKCCPPDCSHAGVHREVSFTAEGKFMLVGIFIHLWSFLFKDTLEWVPLWLRSATVRWMAIFHCEKLTGSQAHWWCFIQGSELPPLF